MSRKAVELAGLPGFNECETFHTAECGQRTTAACEVLENVWQINHTALNQRNFRIDGEVNARVDVIL